MLWILCLIWNSIVVTFSVYSLQVWEKSPWLVVPLMLLSLIFPRNKTNE